jgi:hypothetical protein
MNHRSGKRGIVGGLVLIVLGLLFLAQNLIPGFEFGDYWPAIFIAIGVGLLWRSYRPARSEEGSHETQ